MNDQRFFEALSSRREDVYIAESTIRYLLFDRSRLGGFDASRPDAPLAEPTELGEMLQRLARHPGITLLGTGKPPPPWGALEIERHRTTGANPAPTPPAR